METSGERLVPYRGAALCCRVLMVENLDLYDQVSNALRQVRAKTVKADAVRAKDRSAAALDSPTVDGAGLLGLSDGRDRHGSWAPKGRRRTLSTKLNAAVVDALADPSVRVRLGRTQVKTFCTWISSSRSTCF